MSLKQEVMQCLKEAGLSPRHRFGQNFMIDPNALAAMLEFSDLHAEDRILEIGPGTGLLTERLLPIVKELMCIEIDKGMFNLIERRFSETHVQAVHSDALATKNQLCDEAVAFSQQPWKLVSNLPYEVSFPIILNSLALAQPPTLICVTVQKEAAQRLCAKPGTKAWGASAATAQAAGHGSIVRKLGPKCFFPAPRVDSVILRWEVTDRVEPAFSVWVRKLFGFRRKVISRALRDCGLERDQANAICSEQGLDQGQRVEDLDVLLLKRLFAAIPSA